MHVVASFEHSLYLELALKELEQAGIAKENILAVPLTKKIVRRKMIETVQYDGLNPFDGAFVGATVLMLFGAIYGFFWKWGPVIWALIGLFVGAALGLAYDTIRSRRKKVMEQSKSKTEVVVMVRCEPQHADHVAEILWDHYAFGVAKLDLRAEKTGTEL